MTNKGRAVSVAVGIVVLSGISLAVSFGSHQTIAASFRIVFGTVMLLFVPGYVWSFVFFPAKTAPNDATATGQPLDAIERPLLSLALSMVLTPLSLFLINTAGVKITLVAVIGAIAGLILLGGFVILWQRRTK